MGARFPIQIDPNDGAQLRTYYESLRAWLGSDRSTWEDQWRQLAAFFDPYNARFYQDDVNQGFRRDLSIINETGQLALRTLKAGMLTGMSSQTRPWFKIQAEDPAMNESLNVQAWCETVADIVRGLFLKSNVYETLLNCYGEQGLYGTTAFSVMEDPITVIRCYPFPIGVGGDTGYYLMQDDTLRVDGCVRIVELTVRQMVERFGIKNVSDSIRTLFESNSGGTKEQRYPVVHVIHKGGYFGTGKGSLQPPMPWVSNWYELANWQDDRPFLRRSGFMENPLIVGRWDVIGENTYGVSAGMQCLGSVMSLQAWEERTAQATEKMFNPPMVLGTDIDPRRFNTLPGGIMFADTKDVSKVMQSAYQVDFRIDGALNQIQRIEGRINDAMYRSLFQMFSESDRRDITAEEIRARMSEKMQVLGPVVERNTGEVLTPLVKRTVGIAQRKGLIPPLPDELKGQPMKIEFISILAQAQRMGGLNNLGQYVNFLGSTAAIAPDIMDNLDTDQMAKTYAELADVPAKVQRSPEQVAAMRENRARQQQMAQAAENADKLAGAAKNMSDARLGTGSLLDQALPALAGGG